MMARTIYRLSCEECMCGVDGVRKIPKGWRNVERIRSLRESRRVTPRPGETNFSLSDWETHFGICPDCAKEMDS